MELAIKNPSPLPQKKSRSLPQNHLHTKKHKHTTMTNKQIATAFSDLAKIMELHDENPFKIRSYSSAYLTLRKVEQPLPEMSDEEITALKGVGKTIAGKIRELVESGKMMTYEKYREMTPPGVVDMLKVNGFGPKKVKVVWKELGAESIGERKNSTRARAGIKIFGIRITDCQDCGSGGYDSIKSDCRIC